MQNRSKWLTIFFSCVPGAGHMYLGFMNQGIRLMIGFFLAVFLMGWLNVSLIGFILPVIWCYSVFGAYHLFESGKAYEPVGAEVLFPFLADHSRWVGWGLILLGIIIISERLLLPLISWQMQGYLRTGVVALLFILGGIQLLRGDKAVNKLEAVEGKSEEKEASPCEAGE